ncbi:eukaryotic translation initiation factor 2A [Citrus sinensis]|uniref:Eukaryotic translation initiation factor 2A n=1 Tax=Citrus sinensis TaxID=2711 RepID=A0ACB8MBQ8_CITSI|nr:eukaryotic translation initiation factor 2A [Citrus sinensis]
MASEDASPSLDILVREPEGFFVWNGPPFSNGQPIVKLERVPCTNVRFSEDGSRLMVMKSDSVISIYDCDNFKEIRSFQVPNVAAADLSPCGTYIQTFQKSSTPQEKNVILWKTETGEAVYQLFQKNMTKTTWPSIRFSSDEAVACRMATNEIQFFDTTDFPKGILYRLRVPGVAAFEVSKAPGSHVAVFVPESKGSPASVQIYACGKDLQSQPLARRSFFRCSTVQLNWNRGSTGLLAVAQSDVDKTNQSYYGESKLNYLTTDGTHEGLVPLRKEGPVHDVQWSYSGSEFAVVYGFLCLAGFGNLPGDMAFWDYVDGKQLGTTRAECSVTSEWSPDGRYFMTATTAPRLQIDNGIKIFHHNGSLFFKKMFDKLFQAEWKPVSPDKFGDISELIKSVGSLKVAETKSQGSGSASRKAAPSNPTATKPAAYRPPHAKQAAAIQAELLGESPTPEMSKNALRNKKKREKQKEKKAAEAAAAGI